MQHASHGSIVTVTLTREVRPGEYRTEPICAEQLPTGLYESHATVAATLSSAHRQIKRSLYRKPWHWRST
jgi:hypothetical protein